MNQRQLRLIGSGLTAAACAYSAWHAEEAAAEIRFFGKSFSRGTPTAQTAKSSKTQPVASAANDPRAMADSNSLNERVKLNYFSKTWNEVVNDLARQSGRQPVFEKFPSGRFSRNDWSRYSLDEAIRILNRDLEPKGYRILDRGESLDLVLIRDVRQDYARPMLNVAGKPQISNDIELAADEQKARGAKKVTPPGPPFGRGGKNNVIQLAGHQEVSEDDNADWAKSADASRWVAVTLKHQSARAVSRSLYQAFGKSAELIEQGPNGLPGFVVWSDVSGRDGAAKRRPKFAIGIDTEDERLMIDGSPAEIAAVKKLISRLDVSAEQDDRAVRLITSNRDVQKIAQSLRPAVREMAQRGAAADEAAPKTQPKKGTAKSKAAQKNAAAQGQTKTKSQDEPGEAQAKPPETEMPAEAERPGLVGGLKGDVNVEALDDLGVLILRGNEADVEAVMNIIRQIEAMSAGTTPFIHFQVLTHVDSESLAELLTTVYERLGRSRGQTQAQAAAGITVIAVGKPNAVLVLASDNDLPTVLSLIEQLDQPLDPVSEFEIFRLRYAVASQVVTTLESYFTGRTSGTAGQATQGGSTTRTISGLGGRVRVISDARTNSIIVQARPRDLEEVRRLIGELDQVGSNAVNQIKLIPLRNAVAEELSEMLNLAIQSVIAPPQQPRTSTQGGQLGGAQQFGGASGQVNQQLREAKSAVLRLLDTPNGEEMIESGILADIRINPDPRTNSLVVTAPPESLVLIEALVRKFDQPAALVAEIKHFSIKNADAESVATMLNSLFNNQQQQGQGQRAGANQQNQQLGIQLAGAEDASSQLIPLRLSTDVRTNSIIAVGGAEALSVVEAIILRLDQDDARQRKFNVYRLKNSPATQVATAITQFFQAQSDLANQGNQGLVSQFEQFEREVIVVAESNSNTLLISATPRYYDDIVRIVEGIDMDQQQVVIQALLVEVELTNTDEFGVELGLQDSLLFDRSGTATVGGVANTLIPGFNFNNQPFGNVTPFQSGNVGGQGLSNFSLGRTNGDLGFGGLVLSAGSESVSVLLRALSANRRVEILSRPQIRTLDNQLGRINVGRNVPVVNGFTTNGLAGQIVPTVIRDDSGIILEVTPRITPDDRVVMQIGAERSTYLTDAANSVVLTTDGFGNAIRAPVKEISRAVSTIAVANEQTIVLGGLIQKTDTVIERKVPCLGDVPVIGNAFRFDSHSTRRTELLIFLTPRIVKTSNVNEMLKQIEAQRLHYTESDAEALHGPLFAVPAPPTENAESPVYRPGAIMMSPNVTPTPPAPMPNGAGSTTPPAPPEEKSHDGVEGASYEQLGKRTVAKSQMMTVSATSPANKTVKKATKLETFRIPPSGSRGQVAGGNGFQETQP